MKKGISLVALIITIIVLIILTAAVIWSGADTPEQTKLSVFYNDISTLQDAVTLKILSNVADMETKEWLKEQTDETTGETTIVSSADVNNPYGKYAGLISTDYYNYTTEAVDSTAAGAIKDSATGTTFTITNLADEAVTVEVYPLLPSAINELNVSMSQADIIKFGIDAEGKVYYMPGIWLHPDDNTDVYVTRELITSSITSAKATNIRNY